MTRSSPAPVLGACIVFLTSLALYSWTLAPTVTLVDSGELIVVARYLGVAHPPGVPLWALLAHIATLLPSGNIASRVNFSSALFASLGCAIAVFVVTELLMSVGLATVRKQPAKKSSRRQIRKRVDPVSERAVEEVNGVWMLAPALGAGLLLAFSRTLWSYATITEVYSLNTFLILLVFFLILRWRRCVLSDRKYGGIDRESAVAGSRNGLLYGAALVFGLALGVHHVTVALMLPALGLIVYRTAGPRFFISRRLFYAALISCGALLAVYSYLPLAASRNPIINWGTPRSLEEASWHITGRQYRVFFTFAPELLGNHLAEFGRMVAREFGPVWLPLTLGVAISGFADAFKRDRTTFWFLILAVAADLAYGFSYDIAEDKDAYYLPAFVSIALAAGLGLRWLISLSFKKTWPVIWSWAGSLLLVLLLAAVALAGNWPFNDRRHYFIAHDYVENLLRSIETNGLLLTFDWQVQSPMLYAQEVEQRRRDVKVIDANLLRRPWYFEYLRQAYPDLVARSRVQLDAFAAELKAWERNPQIYDVDPGLNRKINNLFEEMLRTIVTNENLVAPVYITSDVPFADKRDSALTSWINQRFQLVPQGLVFKLVADPSFQDSPDAQLETRGLADGTLRFEREDTVKLKVFPAYTGMLINRGRYLALHNQHARAIAVFQQALALDPSLSLAQKGLSDSTAKLREP